MRLRLDPLEPGLSLRRGPSRRERMRGLPEREGLGPFRLTYLEALLRAAADWRASRGEGRTSAAAGQR